MKYNSGRIRTHKHFHSLADVLPPDQRSSPRAARQFRFKQQFDNNIINECEPIKKAHTKLVNNEVLDKITGGG